MNYIVLVSTPEDILEIEIFSPHVPSRKALSDLYCRIYGNLAYVRGIFTSHQYANLPF